MPDKPIIAYILRNWEDKDYAKAEGNAKNSKTLRPINFVPVVKLRQPDGTIKALQEGDPDAFERVREELTEAGYAGCVAQLRVNYGGVGRGDSVQVIQGRNMGTLRLDRGFKAIVKEMNI